MNRNLSRNLSFFAFFSGLVAVIWVAIGYIGGSLLALAVSCLITAVYLAGALEMRRFHSNTTALAQALGNIPNDLGHLGEWLQQVPLALQNTGRLRIEGERVALPGPGITPYLVGLLVLLGMLGTFLGMVVTLNGAVLALESTTDLQTIRAALAAPVKGLGVAFGTSVAGVATSAMLGLISALGRRDRQQIGQLLDSKIASVLRNFSLNHQRQETFKALQTQTQVLPDLVSKVDAMMRQMAEQHRQLGQQLVSEQQQFHGETRRLYTDLTQSIDLSLKASLKESTSLTAQAIQPVVTATMASIANETRSLHDKLFSSMASQLGGLTQQFTQSVDTVSERWAASLSHQENTAATQQTQLQAALSTHAEAFEQRLTNLLSMQESTQTQLQRDAAQQHQLLSDTFAERSTRLLAELHDTQAGWQKAWADAEATRQSSFSNTLTHMADQLATQWQQTSQQTLAQHENLTQSMTQALADTARDLLASNQQQTTTTIAEVSRLMQTAAEAPKAAAEVIAKLRHELSASIARDNDLLEERSRIMETLATLLDAINHASTEQRQAIDSLVGNSTALLERTSQQFVSQLADETGKLLEVGTHIHGGALEVASLGEAFGHAVQGFSESSDKMMNTLQRIEAGLGKSLTRSDEQLAYYVAQAREIIDLSIMSQQKMVADLQRAALPSAPSGEA